jgi:hypothetical protein
MTMKNYVRGEKNLHLRNLVTRNLTRSKFHTEDSHMLGATVKTLSPRRRGARLCTRLYQGVV